jgi:toxin CptA
MVERLSLRLGPSRLSAAVFVGAHVVAGAALWLAPVPVTYALVCSVVLSVHLVWVVRRHAFRTDARALINLELTDDGAVSVCTRAGLRRAYRVAGSTFVSPLLTVLSLRSETAPWTRRVLIPADSVDPDSFRRLRVWLRWRWPGLAGPRAAARR